jgi:hypothetical protein
VRRCDSGHIAPDESLSKYPSARRVSLLGGVAEHHQSGGTEQAGLQAERRG